MADVSEHFTDCENRTGNDLPCDVESTHKHCNYCYEVLSNSWHCHKHFESMHASGELIVNNVHCYPCKIISHHELKKLKSYHYHCPICDNTVLGRDEFQKHVADEHAVDVIVPNPIFDEYQAESPTQLGMAEEEVIPDELIHESLQEAADNVSEENIDQSTSRFHAANFQQTSRNGVKPLRFRCPYRTCIRRFHTRSGVKQHINTIHDNVRYDCYKCDKSYSTRQDRNIHVRRHHGIEPQIGGGHTCDECGKWFKIRREFILHVQTFHKGRKGDEIIQRLRTNKQGRFKPVSGSTKHRAKRFSCKPCGRYYNSESVLKHHITVVHGGTQPVENDEDDYDDEEDEEEEYYEVDDPMDEFNYAHREQLGTVREWSPVEGDQRFTSAGEPTRNLRRMFLRAVTDDDGEIRFCCQFCDHEGFKTRMGFRYHVEAFHLGLRFKCEYCDLIISTKWQLNNHVKKVHDAQATDFNRVKTKGDVNLPFIPNDASPPPRRAPVRGKVNDPNRERFGCTECDQDYSTRATLNRHMRNAHGAEIITSKENGRVVRLPRGSEVYDEEEEEYPAVASTGFAGPFICVSCCKRFALEEDLQRHIDNIHHGVTFTCSQCNKSFITMDYLGNHITIIHDGVGTYR